MRGIARIAMRGPVAAAITAASFALLGLFFAPALVVSGAVVGLVTLRHGSVEGIKVIAVALAMSVATLLVATGEVGRAGVVVLLPWAPLWCAATVLRSSGNQGAALAMLGAFVAGFALTLRQALGNVDQFWHERLSALADSVRKQGGQFLNDKEISAVAGMMHEASVAVMCLGLAAMLLLARSWQSGLYKPGAFGEEFRALTLPRWTGFAVAALLAVALISAGRGGTADFVGDLLVVLVLLFAAQGLAVTHERTNRLAARRQWLIGLYVFAFIMPHIVATAMALTGIADQIADFRMLRRTRR